MNNLLGKVVRKVETERVIRLEGLISSYLSDPTSLNILDLSQISWVTSLFLKLLPCIPCLWKASTESVKQTGNKTMR